MVPVSQHVFLAKQHRLCANIVVVTFTHQS
jgi:hypothetical protein